MSDGFAWSGACLAAVKAIFGQPTLEASLSGRSVKLSSHCSGLGSPELVSSSFKRHRCVLLASSWI